VDSLFKATFFVVVVNKVIKCNDILNYSHGHSYALTLGNISTSTLYQYHIRKFEMCSTKY